MKKLLSLILVAVLTLGMLASCTFGVQSDSEPTLADALAKLDSLYKSENGKESKTDFELVGSIELDGVKFSVSWTSSSSEIKITKNSDGNYSVDLPSVNDEEFIYTLVATITDADNESEVYTFTKKLPVISVGNKPTPPTNPDDDNVGGDNTQGGGDDTQGGDNTQGGGDDTQGGDNTQGGGDNTQGGGDNTQGGGDNTQGGGDNTQGGGEQTPDPLSKVTTISLNTPYYIWSQNNVGDIYFSGAASAGTLTAAAADAVEVRLEAADGANEYYICFIGEEGKTYIGVDSTKTSGKSTSFKTVTTPDDDCIWLVDASAQCIISTTISDRGMASRTDKEESVFHTYAISNFNSANYVPAWFVHAGALDGDNTQGGGDNTQGGGDNTQGGGDNTQGGGGGNTQGGGDNTQGGTLPSGTYSYTFTSGIFSEHGTKTLGSIDWTLDGNGGGHFGYESTRGQQLGSANNPYSSVTLTSEALSGVTKIVINAAGGSNVNANLIVYVNGQQIGQPASLTNTAETYTFDCPQGLDGEIVIEFLQASSKALFVKSIDITIGE